MVMVERRTKEVNPLVFKEDSLGRHHRLVEALQTPPESSELRQELVGLVKQKFYEEHPELFISTLELFNVAGYSNNLLTRKMEQATFLLRKFDIPVGRYDRKYRRDGELKNGHSHFILASDFEAAFIAVDENRSEFLDLVRHPKKEKYPFAEPQTLSFLKAAIRQGALKRMLQDFNGDKEETKKFVRKINMAGVYYATDLSMKEIGKLFLVADYTELPRVMITDFMHDLWSYCSVSTRNYYKRSKIRIAKPMTKRALTIRTEAKKRTWALKGKKENVGVQKEAYRKAHIIDIALDNLPKSFRVRQALIGLLTDSLYRGRSGYFETGSECVRLSGTGKGIQNKLFIVQEVLRRDHVASTIIETPRRRYLVMYADELSTGAEILKHAPEFNLAA